MRRGPWMVWVVLTAVAMTVVGCESGEGLVIEGDAPATVYDGPMHVPTKELEERTPQALRLASGAAGRALECAGEMYNGNGPDGWSRDDGGNSPEEGLELYFDLFDPGDPRSGYRVERREADRVLYSYDVDGRTKVAVVVAKDQKGRPGWGPETSASCDPSELPADWTDSHGYEIWTDRTGGRVPVTEVSSRAGDDHCGWQNVHFLDLGGRRYARDPEGLLAPGMLGAAYDGSVTLPANARDTGYRYQDQELWLTGDRGTAYLRTPDGVEAWPRLTEQVACM
ncbi:hypothetical protein [Streptomyces sp. TUS-ST3]|uniref:hypothetical protein n=1 Tax=Streptomyces sp. TUS-ST3 TaxID=3025591 RepID=UPI0024E11488|nr:hypothetical protein [Streptomyces sp. TUS-ST3]